MSEEMKKLNTLIAIKIKQDIGDGLTIDELNYIKKIIFEGVKNHPL